MVNDLSHLIDYVPYNQATLTNRVWVTVGDGDQVESLGTGTLVLEGPEHQVVLRDVLYVPDLYTNVLSVSKLTDTDNLAVVFTKSEGTVKPYEGSSRVLLRAKKCDGLYLIDMAKSKVKVCMHVSNANASVSYAFPGSASPVSELSVLWHNRLGHPSQQMTRKLTMSDTVCGLPSFEALVPAFKHPCHDCLAGRFTAKPRTQPAERPTCALELIYADLTGPYTTGIAGSTMCLNVIDAFSGYGISTPIKDKKEACDVLIDSIKRMQMLGHSKVRELRADNDDPVFHSKRLTDWLSDHFINLSHSAPYMHKQVGTVERYNRTIGEITRSLLSHSGRSKYLWPEAMMHACYLYNRRPSTHHTLTHYEVLTGSKPDLSNLVTWGCEAFVHVPKEQQGSKLNPRCYQGIFVGFDEFSPAYRIFARNKIVTRADVIFDESKFGTLYAQEIDTDDRDMLIDVPSDEGEQPAVPHPQPVHRPHVPKPPVQVMSPAQSIINARKRKQNPIMFSATLPPIIEHPFPVFESGKPLPLPANYNEA
jgi:transposase InsO family protein